MRNPEDPYERVRVGKVEERVGNVARKVETLNQSDSVIFSTGTHASAGPVARTAKRRTKIATRRAIVT